MEMRESGKIEVLVAMHLVVEGVIVAGPSTQISSTPYAIVVPL